MADAFSPDVSAPDIILDNDLNEGRWGWYGGQAGFQVGYFSPKERVCFNALNAFAEKITPPFDIVLGGIQISYGICRMYDGDENIEDNFVGYGLEFGPRGLAVDVQDFVRSLSLTLSSIVNGPPTPPPNRIIDYVQFYGMNFILDADLRGSFSLDLDLSYSQTATSITVVDDFYDLEVTLRDLDFYTYAP